MREMGEPENIAPRFLWAGVLALLGLVHPLFFLFAVLVGAMAWFDLNPKEAEKPAPKARRCFVSAADPEWETHFLGACESPAEIAFLEQSIRHFGLTPLDGGLAAPGLTLHLQVEIGAYRADFLAYDWLIIEVDGAAWHSSDAAVARDQERDQFLAREGYRVLRLPAKTVFNRPAEAMRQLEAAIFAGRPERPRKPQPEVDFGKALDGLTDFVEGINRATTRLRNAEVAMREPRRIFGLEQMLLQGAVESAERQIRIAEFRSASQNNAELFDEARKGLSEDLEKHQDNVSQKSDRELIHLGPVERPSRHSDPETDQAIDNAFESLLQDRADLFARIKQRAADDPNLAVHAVSYLEKFGCKNLWRDALAYPERKFARSKINLHALLLDLQARSGGA